MTKTKAKTAKTKTAAKIAAEAVGTDRRLAEMLLAMRNKFVKDARTLKPEAVAAEWNGINRTEVFVLLIAGGKGKNQKFTVGGVFATDALAEQKALDLGIDPTDIVRAWDEDNTDNTDDTGDTILKTLYTGRKIQVGKATILRLEVEGAAYNAATLLEGKKNYYRSNDALDALFDPKNPMTPAEVWVRLGFLPKASPFLGGKLTLPVVELEVIAADPKTYPLMKTQQRADEFVKVAVTRTA